MSEPVRESQRAPSGTPIPLEVAPQPVSLKELEARLARLELSIREIVRDELRHAVDRAHRSASNQHH